MKKSSLSILFSYHILWIVCLFSIFSEAAVAQDERVLRYILRKKSFENNSSTKKNQFRITSKWYDLDLNGDKRAEKISMESNDGVNSIVIRNHRNFPIFQQNFLTQAFGGVIHKIRLVQVSENIKTLLIYYFEGKTEYINFRSTGRLYFISWVDNDLSTMKMTQGPQYWHESKNYRGQYFNRRSKVYLKDFNGDGLKEILVKQGTISRVYHLIKNNVWKKLSTN